MDNTQEPPPPPPASELARCLDAGGALAPQWSVDNQHGPVTTVVAGDVIVLGGADGSVKQWAFDGDTPVYGSPLSGSGEPVSALALAPDGNIAAGAPDGTITEWRLADASHARTLEAGGLSLTALAIRPDGAQVVVGDDLDGPLRALDRETGEISALQTMLWSVAAIVYGEDGTLVTAGHWYGAPHVEIRDATDPVIAADTWSGTGWNATFRAVDLDENTATLAAAGDGFVAMFATEHVGDGPYALAEVADHVATGAALLPGGALLVTAGSEGTLRVWDAATLELVMSLAIPSAVGLATDPAGTRLFTSGPDGRLHAFGCR